jgi:predicted nucleotidyltransferase
MTAWVMTPELTSLLTQLHTGLSQALGDNLLRVTLYGSHARGHAAPDSDVDVLIVLRRAPDSDRETAHRIAYQLMWDQDFRHVLALNVIDADHYALLRDRQSSYLDNVEAEGKLLWPAT